MPVLDTTGRSKHLLSVTRTRENRHFRTRPEQAWIAELRGGSQTARFASVEGSHMEPIENADSPDLHPELRFLAHYRSRQKTDPRKILGKNSRTSPVPFLRGIYQTRDWKYTQENPRNLFAENILDGKIFLLCEIFSTPRGPILVSQDRHRFHAWPRPWKTLYESPNHLQGGCQEALYRMCKRSANAKLTLAVAASKLAIIG